MGRSAETRWAKLLSTPERVLENPVTITTQQSNSGWAVTFQIADFKARSFSTSSTEKAIPIDRIFP